MKLTILLKNENDSSEPVMVSEIERTGPLNAASLGLTIAESKCLLANVQKELVESQVQYCVQERRICTRCGSWPTLKDYHAACFRSLFGDVKVLVRHAGVPRLNGCSCEGDDERDQSVKIDGLVNWVSPELEFIQSKLAAMIPYARTADLLELLLPVDAGNAPSTVRRRALSVGQRLDTDLHQATDLVDVECSKIDTAQVTDVGLDSGYVKDCRPQSEGAFNRIRAILFTLRLPTIAGKKVAVRMRRLIKELLRYLKNNQGSLANYGGRYRRGKRISTAFMESAVNQLIDKRMSKSQQMRWSPEGAHALLQVRAELIDGRLAAAFSRWYPGFAGESRPSQVAI